MPIRIEKKEGTSKRQTGMEKYMQQRWQRIMLCYIRSSNIEKIYATYIAKVTKQDLKSTIKQYRNKTA